MNMNNTNVNLRHHRALTACEVSHNGVTDTNSILMKECTTHHLQLNPWHNRRLNHLTAERVNGGHVPHVSNMHLITHSPYLFSLQAKEQRC